MRIGLSILALLAVAACSSNSSTGGGTAGVDESAPGNGDSGLTFESVAAAAATASDADAVAFAQVVDVFQTDVGDVNGRSLDDYSFTAFTSVPTSGTASYSGLINVNAGAAANLSAGLDLDADFGAGTLTADQTTDFYANAGGTLQAYDGELTFSNGAVGLRGTDDDGNDILGARGVANAARLDIAGTLTGGGNTVVVDGEIFGKLVGTPVVGISANTTVAEAAARSNPDRAMNITLNGTAVTDGSAGFVVIDDTLR